VVEKIYILLLLIFTQKEKCPKRRYLSVDHTWAIWEKKTKIKLMKFTEKYPFPICRRVATLR